MVQSEAASFGSSPQLPEATLMSELVEGLRRTAGTHDDVYWEGRGSWAVVIEDLCQVLPSRLVLAVVDHAFGVVPLLAYFEVSSPAIESAWSGRALASLGLFTANARFSLGPSLTGRRTAEGVLLRGRMNRGIPEAVSTLLLVAVDDDVRLCLVPHELPRMARSAAGAPQDHGLWLDLEDVFVEDNNLSRSMTMAPREPLAGVLDAYAGAASLAAGLCASRLLRALRLGMGQRSSGGAPFNTSQLAAHEVTRMEIESELLLSALRNDRCRAPETGAVPLLAASTKLLHRVISTADEWNIGLGLGRMLEEQGFDVPVAREMPLARSWMAEGELAHRMGLR